MTRDEVLSTLAENREALAPFGVKSLAVFGSVARNEATAASDVDLLVEFDRPVGLFDFVRLQHRLEEILGVPKVDLVTPAGLREPMREQILKEAVRSSSG